ncbi:MAG: ubiquitin-like domain-containing protein [Sarcina sp.]
MIKRFGTYLKEKNFFDSPKKKVLAFLTGAALVCVVYVGTSYKQVTINVDGNEMKTTTLKWTVQGVLEQNNIVLAPKDKIEPSLEQSLKRGDSIKIKKAKDIILLADGSERTIQTAEDSVDEILKAENIAVDNDDRVSPEKDAEVKAGDKIQITRVEEQLVTSKAEIAYETEVKENNKLEKGTQKVVQEGAAGEKEVVTKVIYEDGNEFSRKVVSEKVIKEPKSKIVEKGTKAKAVVSPTSNSSSGNSGSGNSSSGNFSYKKKMVMQATAYAGDGTTATGRKPVRNPNGYSTIAVDPRVIPLGTKVYIEGYGYAIAADTGGAIKNNIIDLFMNSESECIKWGRRNVVLYVL